MKSCIKTTYCRLSWYLAACFPKPQAKTYKPLQPGPGPCSNDRREQGHQDGWSPSADYGFGRGQNFSPYAPQRLFLPFCKKIWPRARGPMPRVGWGPAIAGGKTHFFFFFWRVRLGGGGLVKTGKKLPA